MEPVLFYAETTRQARSDRSSLWNGSANPTVYHGSTCPKRRRGRPLHRKLNPARKVPLLLLEDGTRLSVKRGDPGDLQHLAFRDMSKGLTFAQGTPEYDHLNRVLAFGEHRLLVLVRAGVQSVRHGSDRREEPARPENAEEFGLEEIEKAHAGLEAMIGDQQWLAGDTRTIADAYFAGICALGSVP